MAEQVVAKQDIRGLRTEMQADFAAVRTEIDAPPVEMRSEFAAMRAEILSAELAAEFFRLR